MHNLLDIEKSFIAAMAEHGVTIEEPIITDGALHRFHVKGDKASSINGWYILFIDRIPCGRFGNWKTNLSAPWSAKSRQQMSHFELIKHRKLMAEAQRQRQEALREKHQHAALRASEIWNTTQPANPAHPYLLKKQISVFTAHQSGTSLILPICDIDGQLWSLQFIRSNGTKILLSGGAKKRHFIPINGQLSSPRILICEGFATGCTLAQHNPTACVIAAIDAGNLQPVAITVRQRFPHTQIVICADDDRQTTGNPGATCGKQAAIAANASFELPQWPIDAPDTLTDYNDLTCWLNSKEKQI